jgi:uncharacterized cupredoxin-like copper-binding protein
MAVGKKKGGQQWLRVFGPNLQPMHEERHKAAVNRFKDQSFKDACSEVNVAPTKRQARKWNNKRGAAYNFAHNIEMNGFNVANMDNA